MKALYQIEEYGSFVADREIDGYVTLPAHIFAQLEEFILTNQSGANPLDLMNLSIRRSGGKVLTARNYVGVIALRDGSAIEILPKICPASDSHSRERARRLLIEMLGTLPDAPYKSIHSTGIDVARMSILEAFIRMFIDEVYRIAKRGLPCGYEAIEENANFLRGKLNIPRHIRENAAHRERFFIAHDHFSTNRPENRLIKSTLLRLHTQSQSTRNRSDLRLLLNVFDDVPPSGDFAADFARCIPDRNAKDCARALIWCRVFLMGQGFTPFAGRDVALALLFPMETLFERYIAVRLKSRLSGGGFHVAIQDAGRHLFDAPRQFRLRPDIVVTRKSDGAVFVLDTKWKLLSANKSNLGIAQADMYQLYVYQKKYDARSAMLIYPEHDGAPSGENLLFSSGDGAHIRVQFVDLFDIRSSLDHLADLLSLRSS